MANTPAQWNRKWHASVAFAALPPLSWLSFIPCPWRSAIISPGFGGRPRTGTVAALQGLSQYPPQPWPWHPVAHKTSTGSQREGRTIRQYWAWLPSLAIFLLCTYVEGPGLLLSEWTDDSSLLVRCLQSVGLTAVHLCHRLQILGCKNHPNHKKISPGWKSLIQSGGKSERTITGSAQQIFTSSCHYIIYISWVGVNMEV